MASARQLGKPLQWRSMWGPYSVQGEV